MGAAMTRPNYAVHPGSMLDEWLEENGVSQVQMATRLGRSTKNINQVVNGVADVSAELALSLETVTGVPARLWINMQANYDEAVARIRREEALSNYVGWLEKVPVADLRRRGFITATARDKLAQVQEAL